MAPPLEAVVSGAAYAVLALFLGALAVGSLVMPAAEDPFRRALLSFARVLLLAFLAVAILSLIVQGAKLAGGNAPTLDILARYLVRTQSGRIWLARELYGAALVLLLVWLAKRATPERAARWAFFLALPLVASRSLMSHAAAVRENTVLAVSADAIHLVVTALWAGGLPVLFWMLWRATKRSRLPLAWAAETVSRFSRLALFSVAVIVPTGLYQSWVHVQSWSALFGSDYGGVLLLKLFLFLLMATLGAINLFSTKPALARAASEEPLLGKNKMLNRIGVESALGLLIFAVTGLLTMLPPGAHSRHQAAAPVAGVLQPAEGAGIKILSPRDGEIFHGDQVPIHFKLVAGKRGHHAHAYVDGVLMGMFESEKGTLTGISPGRHALELRVVAENHQTELDAGDRIQFVVK
jgi:putative copper export protein